MTQWITWPRVLTRALCLGFGLCGNAGRIGHFAGMCRQSVRSNTTGLVCVRVQIASVSLHAVVMRGKVRSTSLSCPCVCLCSGPLLIPCGPFDLCSNVFHNHRATCRFFLSAAYLKNIIMADMRISKFGVTWGQFKLNFWQFWIICRR